MTESRTRVLVADDQRDVRAAFRLVLDAQPDMVTVAEACDGAAAVDTARRIGPDVVLMDVRMPSMDGLDALRALAADPATAGVRVIVVTTFDLDEYVGRALALGAAGFLLKRSGPALLVEAVRAAMSGDVLISPQLTVRLLHRMGGMPRPPTDTGYRLTSRELDIVRQVAHGRTNAEIGSELFISPGTVKTHLANIAAKLHRRTRVGIAAWAWEHGVVSAAPPAVQDVRVSGGPDRNAPR